MRLTSKSAPGHSYTQSRSQYSSHSVAARWGRLIEFIVSPQNGGVIRATELAQDFWLGKQNRFFLKLKTFFFAKKLPE